MVASGAELKTGEDGRKLERFKSYLSSHAEKALGFRVLLLSKTPLRAKTPANEL